MATTQASNFKIDTLYVHEAMEQSAEAYKNLLLLALKNRTDLCRLGSAIDNAMKNESAGKRQRLHESFRGIAYMSAFARENDRSLLKILYMGPKEQKALLRRIVKDISADQITDFKMLDPVRKAAEFKVMLYTENPASDQSSASGYLMTFRKRAVGSEEGLSYTLEARFIRGDSDFEDPYFLFREQTLAWEEFTGDLATCIEKIISLKPSIDIKKSSKPEINKIEINEVIDTETTKSRTASSNGNTTFRNVVSRLLNGLRGTPATQESPIDKSAGTDKSSSMVSSQVKKEADNVKNTGLSNDEKPKKQPYKIVKCEDPVMYHMSENSKPMYMVISNVDGNDVYISVVVNRAESHIYVDSKTYEKYRSLIKNKVVLKDS